MIRFVATAYNYGFFHSEKEITEMSGQKILLNKTGRW